MPERGLHDLHPVVLKCMHDVTQVLLFCAVCKDFKLVYLLTLVWLGNWNYHDFAYFHVHPLLANKKIHF